MGYYAQRGEDKLLENIFKILGIKEGYLVDVGAYGKELSNTYHFLEQGWSGLLIESDEARFNNLIHNDKVKRLNKHVDNLELDGTPIDLLSIDIDGNDYYIWKSVKSRPKVVIIEFNPTLSGYYVQPKDGKGGASLEALVELGKTLGYELIATTPFNAIFIDKKYFSKFKIKDNSISALFKSNNETYG